MTEIVETAGTEKKVNPFQKTSFIPEEKPKEYDHGYPPEKVEEIKRKYLAIQKRDLNEEPVTIEETRDVIVPWNRIHRTEAFNLNPEKPKKEKKERVAKPKAVKEPKPKKLTKAQIEKRIKEYHMNIALGLPVTEEDELFVKEHGK